MKILLHYPEWKNRWIPYIQNELSCYDVKICHSRKVSILNELSHWADILFSMWTNEVVQYWTKAFPDKKIIAYLRRFEMWEQSLFKAINFNKINAMIFVSDFYRKLFQENHNGIPKTYLIPNGIDLDQFPLIKKTGKANKIACVGQLKHVKNFPLALQILLELPKKYTLHQIGLAASEQLAGQIFSYTHNMGLKDRMVFHPNISSDLMPGWYQDKDCILSTSINEGNPNCIIEAMAMGIKPIIHNWPGAKEQFPHDLVFNTIDEAKSLIENDEFEPEFYRSWIEERYSLKNFERIHEVIGAL